MEKGPFWGPFFISEPFKKSERNTAKAVVFVADTIQPPC